MTRMTAFALLLLAASASTQGIYSTDSLAGWEEPGRIQMQEAGGNCLRLKTCNSVLGVATSAVSGGSAYDSRFQALWVSNGQGIQLRSLDTCNPICSFAAAHSAANMHVSGLAFDADHKLLWQVEQDGAGHFGYVVYDVSGAPTTCATPLRRCSGNLPVTGGFVAGLAYDVLRNVIYTTISWNDNGYKHAIIVTEPSDPCRIVCRWTLPSSACPQRILQGAAYDACNRRLTVTDGIVVQTIVVGDPRLCQMTLGTCCPAAALYRGLAFVPGWGARRAGASCLGAGCRSCPTMRGSVIGGAPALGSDRFGFSLIDAPSGDIGVLFVQVGACSPPVTAFCGQFYAWNAPLIFAQPIVGVGCNGTAEQRFPIPAIPAACGHPLCAQWLVVCGGGSLGLSDAVEVLITQ